VSMLGQRHTPEAKARISAALKGHPVSPEARARIGAANAAYPHPSVPYRTKPALSAALKGHRVSAETRAKISASLMGRPFPPERARPTGNSYVVNAPVKGECVYCGEPAQTNDHVIPRGRPGWDESDNVVLACFPCNRSKQARTPEEWFASLVIQERARREGAK
jgi:5-methylcytosine-specific restriction endonuclease McrA